MPKRHTESELEYMERVSKYINMDKIRNKTQLRLELTKKFNTTTTKQENLAFEEAGFAIYRRISVRRMPNSTVYKEIYDKGGKTIIKYRDSKTGKLIKWH